MVWVSAMRPPPAVMISLSIFMKTCVLILTLDDGGQQSAVRGFRETADCLSEGSILYPRRACVMGLTCDNCHVKDSLPRVARWVRMMAPPCDQWPLVFACHLAELRKEF